MPHIYANDMDDLFLAQGYIGRAVKVWLARPVASFEVTSTGRTFTFASTSVDAEELSWDLGDGPG